MQKITHRVRTFLRQQGAAIEPWSGLDATYSELYELLDRRRDDPTLWGPLEDSVERELDAVLGAIGPEVLLIAKGIEDSVIRAADYFRPVTHLAN